MLLLIASPLVGSVLASAAAGRPEAGPLWRRIHAPASRFHAAIELAAVLLAVAAATLLDGWRVVAGCGFGWALLLLAAVDVRRRVLPDRLALALLAAGLLVALSYEPDRLADRALAASGGWLAVAMLSASYRRATGRPGSGGGEARLLAAIGAWVGPEGLAWTLALAASGGLAAAGALAAQGGWRPGRRLPSGPFLAMAGWLVWVFA
jgi:leader peptidase (prepilin peptidase) / N-methyltransferase